MNEIYINGQCVCDAGYYLIDKVCGKCPADTTYNADLRICDKIVVCGENEYYNE